MKKKTRFERKEAFRKAYYNEMKKQGTLDPVEEEVAEEVEGLAELTRSALMKMAKDKGLKVENKMTKSDLEDLIGGVNYGK